MISMGKWSTFSPQRLEIEEEIQRHQQALKEENRKRRETREVSGIAN